jgi:ATP-dependent Clp protease ATP-binding subunit ClpA
MGNFTPRALQVLALARTEADRLNHNFLGTEHILLGLIKLGQGVAFNVLLKMGLVLETVRMEVEKQVGTRPGPKITGNTPYTPRVKKVFALAQKEAKNLNHTYVGTEHLLLGLLQEGGGVAAKVFRNLDVDIERTRREILKELDPNSFGCSPVGEPANNPSSRPAEEAGGYKMSASETAGFAVSFTPRAIQVFKLARKEADRFHHNYLGTEHLLLGLIKLGQGVSSKVLQNLGLSLEAVRAEVEKWAEIGPHQKIIGNIPYTPRVKKVIAFAQDEAKRLNHTYVGTEHLLLGLLREGEGPAAKIFDHFKVNAGQIYRDILKELDPKI